MKKKSLWIYIFGITIIIIGLIKLDTLISMISILWNACRVLVFGAMMAFVINLVMVKIEKRLGFMKKGKRATSLLLSLILIFLFVYFLITLVVPSLSEAIGVIVQALPKYFENTQKFLVNLFKNIRCEYFASKNTLSNSKFITHKMFYNKQIPDF